MTYEDAFSIIKKWVMKCNEEKPLYPSYFDTIIRDRIMQAMKDKKYPIEMFKLKIENRESKISLLQILFVELCVVFLIPLEKTELSKPIT
jgi:phage terminase large subunit-like protein